MNKQKKQNKKVQKRIFTHCFFCGDLTRERHQKKPVCILCQPTLNIFIKPLTSK